MDVPSIMSSFTSDNLFLKELIALSLNHLTLLLLWFPKQNDLLCHHVLLIYHLVPVKKPLQLRSKVFWYNIIHRLWLMIYLCLHFLKRNILWIDITLTHDFPQLIFLKIHLVDIQIIDLIYYSQCSMMKIQNNKII